MGSQSSREICDKAERHPNYQGLSSRVTRLWPMQATPSSLHIISQQDDLVPTPSLSLGLVSGISASLMPHDLTGATQMAEADGATGGGGENQGAAQSNELKNDIQLTSTGSQPHNTLEERDQHFSSNASFTEQAFHDKSVQTSPSVPVIRDPDLSNGTHITSTRSYVTDEIPGSSDESYTSDFSLADKSVQTSFTQDGRDQSNVAYRTDSSIRNDPLLRQILETHNQCLNGDEGFKDEFHASEGINEDGQFSVAASDLLFDPSDPVARLRLMTRYGRLSTQLEKIQKIIESCKLYYPKCRAQRKIIVKQFSQDKNVTSSENKGNSISPKEYSKGELKVDMILMEHEHESATIFSPSHQDSAAPIGQIREKLEHDIEQSHNINKERVHGSSQESESALQKTMDVEAANGVMNGQEKTTTDEEKNDHALTTETAIMDSQEERKPVMVTNNNATKSDMNQSNGRELMKTNEQYADGSNGYQAELKEVLFDEESRMHMRQKSDVDGLKCEPKLK